jgi:hypothetical protein
MFDITAGANHWSVIGRIERAYNIIGRRAISGGEVIACVCPTAGTTDGGHTRKMGTESRSQAVGRRGG